MDKEEYLETQQKVVLFANMVKDLPLKEFIELADRADAIGPIMDPTLWRNGHENLDIIRRLAGKLRSFQVEAVNVLEESKHVKV
jgi:hypothetical protein